MTPISSAEDWSLLTRSRREPEALAELFRRHRDFVYRVSYASLRNADQAEETTQDVFYRLARQRRPLIRRARFTTWLYRVTRNCVTDQLRKSNHQADHPVAEPSQQDTSGASCDLDAVLAAMAGLPERQRQVVLLRIFEGHSVAETAALLGVGEGSVKTHLHRGLHALRNRFNPTEGEQR